MEVQLVVTEKCNLQCKYCYMDKNPTTMPRDIFDKYYAKLPKLLKLFDSDCYNVVYFGGEPLLNLDLIYYSLPIFENDPKCNRMIIITNGSLLTTEIHDHICSYKKAFASLSFDGLWQDLNRPGNVGTRLLDYINKEDKVLSRFKSHKCMVAPPNLNMIDNYVFLKKMGFTFVDFTIVRDNIWSPEDIVEFEKQLDMLMARHKQDILAGEDVVLGFVQLYLKIFVQNDLFQKQQKSCYAGNSGLGFMPSGIAYPCARFGSKKLFPIYDVHSDTFNVENIATFGTKITTNPGEFEKCKECILFRHCNAGCTYSQYENGNQPLDCVCDLFKIIYKSIFSLVDELKLNANFNQYVKRILQ